MLEDFQLKDIINDASLYLLEYKTRAHFLGYKSRIEYLLIYALKYRLIF